MITIYADGSALGTPGPGGWAFCVLNDGLLTEEHSGSAANVTNNQMELQAAIEALRHVGPLQSGIVRCDSQYVVKGINEWRKGWERSGWRKSGGGAVLNAGLWRSLFTLVDAHPGLRFEWVKGHDADKYNNLVDRLARTAAENLRDHGRGRRIDAPLAESSFTMVEPAILQAMTKLKSDMEKLTQLSQIGESQGWEAVKGMFGDKAGSWVLHYNMSLGAAPIDLLLDGRDDKVVTLIARIEHGVCA